MSAQDRAFGRGPLALWLRSARLAATTRSKTFPHSTTLGSESQRRCVIGAHGEPILSGHPMQYDGAAKPMRDEQRKRPPPKRPAST
jgi:hypothetical protein